MIKSNDQYQTYLRCLNLVSAIRELPRLDAFEERVLKGLAATGASITVLQAKVLTPDTSPTTMQRRLKSLRKLGLIDQLEDQQNTRIKYVVATASGKAYFAKLGQCLDRATKGT